KVRFLSNNQQAKYIYKVQPGTGSWENQNGTPPVWSEDALNTGSDSYFNSFTDLSSPGWSYDGNYISFIHSTPGGESSFGLYDIKGGRYLPSARGCDLRWSPVENSYLLSRCDYGGGLFKSQKNDLASLVRLLEGEFSDSEINYSAPAYAADGSRVAFLYSREFEDQIYLGLAKADGSAFTEVAANLLYDYQHRSGPFFSADGNRIYYMKEIAGMQVLLTRELPDGEESNFLIMPGGYVNWFFMRWTAEGYLAIVGTYYHDFETSGARLIIIDPSAGNLVYAGAPINGFVYFAGFSKVPY
ncbi:MAG: hypothetical protein U1E11_07345, partial [Dethiobacteria bacterium]|nr:hypothetical protein [Dethiobacteria bacterium]